MTITRQQLENALRDSKEIPQASASEILKRLWPDEDTHTFHVKKKGKNEQPD